MTFRSHSCNLIISLTVMILSQHRATSADVLFSDSLTASNHITTDINGHRLAVVCGVTGTAFAIGHVYLNTLWWKGQYSDFHINSYQDNVYALGADKLGHATFAFMAATVYADAMRWCGFDSTSATWIGFGVAMAYQTFVEVRDGFSADYGFSWGDAISNTVGASLCVAKHYTPALRAFDLQVSYWPSQKYRDGAYSSIIDDYESTTHWLTISPYQWMPASWQTWYPPWLGVAIGHSVQNIDGQGGGNHVITLSLDWDLQHLPVLPAWLQRVFRILHLYHLPAPAVQIYPNLVWYGLKF